MSKYRFLFFAFFLLSFTFFGKTILISGEEFNNDSVSSPQEYVSFQKTNKQIVLAKSIFNSDLHKDKAEITETEIEEDDVQETSFFGSYNFDSTSLTNKLPFNHQNIILNGLKTSIYKEYLSSIQPIHILICIFRI